MKIYIVGGFPSPVGGVTNFLYRFSLHFNKHVQAVFDLYPSDDKKIVDGVEYFLRPGSRMRSLFWLISHISKIKSGTIYFNFSSPKALIILTLLPKRKTVKWALTLHHGELEESWLGIPIFFRWASKFALLRIDRVGALGSRQRCFFDTLGVSNSRLYNISSYLPFVEVGSVNDDEVENSIGKYKEQFSKIVVASGYPTALYRHDWVLDYFRDTAITRGAGLVLCLYGGDSEGLLAEYRERTSKMENVIYFEGLSPNFFHKVLAGSDVYVRPTLKDSYGVAVAEAIDLGLTVIASNACERANGAYTFDRFDKRQFFELLDDALAGRIVSQNTILNDGRPSLQAFLEIE